MAVLKELLFTEKIALPILPLRGTALFNRMMPVLPLMFMLRFHTCIMTGAVIHIFHLRGDFQFPVRPGDLCSNTAPRYQVIPLLSQMRL